MKIALAAAKTFDGDIPRNLAQIQRFAARAHAQGAQLVCFGESFLQGFYCCSWQYEQDRQRAVSVDSETFRTLCALSQQLCIDLLFGFIELCGRRLYSSCALLSDGQLHTLYRRISPGWKERRRTDAHYCEGETVKPFLYRGCRCAIALCGDLWDDPARFAVGAELLFWPVYVEWPPQIWEAGGCQEYAAQAALACSHTLYVNALSDRADSQTGDTALGGAALFVDGGVRQQLPVGREGLLVVEV